MNRNIFILIFAFFCLSYNGMTQENVDSLKQELNQFSYFDNTYFNFENQLAGQIAGVNITSRGGLPGAGSNIAINGFQSFSQNTMPLIVVDGVLYNVQNQESPVIRGLLDNLFNAINGFDIESVEFLQGASALKYGSQSGRGVIIIKTKDNKDLETSITFNSVLSANTLYRTKPLLNREQFNGYAIDLLKTEYEMYEIMNGFPYLFYDSDHVNYNNFNQNTLWQDEIYKRSLSHKYNLAVKGGDAIAKYYLSVGYQDDKGIVMNTNNRKYNTKFSVNINVARNFDIDVNVALTEFNINAIESAGFNNNSNPMASALLRTPMLGAYDIDHENITQNTYTKIYDFGVSNPIAILNDNRTNSKGNFLSAFVNFSYKLNDYFDMKLTTAVNSAQNRQNNFISGRTSNAVVPTWYFNKFAENMSKHFISKHRVQQINYSLGYTNDKLLKGFGAQLGTRYLEDIYENDYGVGINTSSDNFVTLGQTSSAEIRQILGNYYGYKLLQFHGSSSLNVTDKMEIQLLANIDGNSNVGVDANRFGFFYGTNLNYEFLKNDESKFLNYLKVRYSYHKSANTNIDNNKINRYYVSSPFGNLAGLKPFNIANNQLKWEDVYSSQLNILSTLFRVIHTDLTIYQNRIKDMIVFKNLPNYTGFDGIFVNGGEMKSTGFNVGISGDIKINNLLLNIYANTGHNVSEITKLPDDKPIIKKVPGGELIATVGSGGYQFFGYNMKKVISTKAEADSYDLYSKNGQKYEAGDIKFEDLTKDNVIDEKDRMIIGDPKPDYFGGFGFNSKYKQLSLRLNFTYSIGNDVFNYMRMLTEGQSELFNQSTNVLNAWVKEGDITDVPRLNYGDPLLNNAFSNRFIEDGSYLKLSNLNIGYDLNITTEFIQSVKINLSAQNLWFTSKYTGYDPVFSFNDNPIFQGIDYGKMPNPRSFILNLQIGF